jgi:hypothetical protein
MAIPALNGYGLLPDGIHDCTVAEVAAFFCGNQARQVVWQAFLGFLQWASAMPQPAELLIDGSFVTDKDRPSDIDVAVDITNCPLLGQGQWLIAFHQGHAQIKQQFRTDFYPFSNHWGNNFGAFFQYVRMDEALARGAPNDAHKGILRLIP